MKIAIRVDASLLIGTGHVMRCLSLADELRKQGDDVSFVCRSHPGQLAALIESRGHGVSLLPAADGEVAAASEDGPAHASWLGVSWETDAAETRGLLESAGGVDWLVVDHYALDARWETCQRPVAKRIMAIDDLADRAHDCDLLLDQNLHEDAVGRRAGRLPAGCGALHGPRFALLREQFAAARRALRERDGTVRRVLVFFGGIDAGNLTGRVLPVLARLAAQRVAVDVVLGTASPHCAAARAFCANQPGMAFHEQVEDMASLMAEADLAIGGAGTAVWERCCLGLPAIVVPLAANQLPGLRLIAESGCAFVVGDATDSATDIVACIDAALAFSMRSPAALRHQSRQASGLVDGRGAMRVARRLQASTLSMRRATAADSGAILAWRNHPEIRRHSRNAAPIDPAAHAAWFERVLSDRQTDLLVCELADIPVGVVRYDRRGAAAEVSIYVVPARLGAGWGGAVLAAGESWLRAEHPEVAVLAAEVLPANEVSMRMFRDAGYSVALEKLDKPLNV